MDNVPVDDLSVEDLPRSPEVVGGRTHWARPRPRELGVRLGSLEPGPLNAITDVSGVLVGHVTLIVGEGPLVPGRGPVRTGVTAIRPHGGNLFTEKVPAAAFVLNGFGKSIGLPQVDELGSLETPILLTNTLGAPLVADALIDYMIEDNPEIGITTSSVNPVVGECNDGFLNDIQGRHVRKEHVLVALGDARNGSVAEGSVGAGAGMVCFRFKGGIGSASRRLSASKGGYTVGALVLANFGIRDELTIAGVPVGRLLNPVAPVVGRDEPVISTDKPAMSTDEPVRGSTETEPKPGNAGSIIIVLATDAPLDSRGLGRLARRATMGLARTGSTMHHGSGDFVLAFSTAYRIPHDPVEPLRCVNLLNETWKTMDPLFQATVEATEEAIVNALFAAGNMAGRDGNSVPGLPVEDVLDLLRHYGRVEPQSSCQEGRGRP